MRWTSIVAIYTLLWVLSAFLVMPFGMRTNEELGDSVVTGHADSAPAKFRPGRIMARATVLAAVLFALFYLNYVEGWITPQSFNIFGNGPAGYKDPPYVDAS